MGEGHIDLCKSGRGTSLCPRLRLAVREDDAAVLRWIQDMFGGALSYRANTRSWCWQITGKDRVARIAAVLDACPMPSKKKTEVKLLLRALDLVPTRGVHINADALIELRALKDQMIASRGFYGSH